MKNMKNVKNSVRKKQFGKIMKLVFGITVIMLIGYLIAPTFQVPPEYIIVPLATTLAGGMLSTRANRLINSLSILAPSFLLDEDTQTRQEAELRVAALKEIDRTNKTNQWDEIVYELNARLSICEYYTNQSQPSLSVPLMPEIRTLMRIPSHSLSQLLESQYNKEQLSQLREKMLSKTRKLISPFDLRSRLKLVKFTSALINHILPMEDSQSQSRVRPLLLIGPPGVGKTHFVQEIARIFGIPLCKIDMGKFSLEEFEGRQLPGSSGTIARPGAILSTQSNKFLNPRNCNNLILMLDELDKCFHKSKDGLSENTSKIIGLLNPLLQVDTLTWQDKGYNVPMNLKQTIFIGTGNEDFLASDILEKHIREPLANRIDVVLMPTLKEKGKLEILSNHIKNIVLKDKKTDILQKRLLLILMNAHAKFIVWCDKNPNLRTPEPGVRNALNELENSYNNSLNLNLQDKDGLKSVSGRILSFLDPQSRKSFLKSTYTSSPSKSREPDSVCNSVCIDILEPSENNSLREREGLLSRQTSQSAKSTNSKAKQRFC